MIIITTLNFCPFYLYHIYKIIFLLSTFFSEDTTALSSSITSLSSKDSRRLLLFHHLVMDYSRSWFWSLDLDFLCGILGGVLPFCPLTAKLIFMLGWRKIYTLSVKT